MNTGIKRRKKSYIIEKSRKKYTQPKGGVKDNKVKDNNSNFGETLSSEISAKTVFARLM